MSGTGESSTDFAGEEREFCIRLGEIRRIQDKCGVGIGEVARRLAHAVFVLNSLGKNSMVEALAAGIQIHADDVRETIYQGLLGRGMPSADAIKLVRAEIDNRGMAGLLDHAGTALCVLIGANETPEGEDDAPGEPQAGESPATPSAKSTSKRSTASAKPSA